ncbi:MAG: hypothetical protein AAF353_08480 [Pseudomonadota bacterium]
MITIIAGLAAIFVALVGLFALLKNPSKVMIAIAGMITITLCWGLIDWQLTNQLEAIICPHSDDVCSVNLSRIYESPVIYEKFERVSSLGSLNTKWGWMIWTLYFLIAYGVARRARKQLNPPTGKSR